MKVAEVVVTDWDVPTARGPPAADAYSPTSDALRKAKSIGFSVWLMAGDSETRPNPHQEEAQEDTPSITRRFRHSRFQ